MALIIGVKRGDRFFLNDTPVDVVATVGHKSILIEIESARYALTKDESVQIYPNVYASVGLPKDERNLPRIVIDAPRNIVVLREELYHRRVNGSAKVALSH